MIEKTGVTRFIYKNKIYKKIRLYWDIPYNPWYIALYRRE